MAIDSRTDVFGVEREVKGFTSHFKGFNRYTDPLKSNRLSSLRSLAAYPPFVLVGNDWLTPISDMHAADQDIMQGRRMQGHMHAHGKTRARRK